VPKSVASTAAHRDKAGPVRQLDSRLCGLDMLMNVQDRRAEQHSISDTTPGRRPKMRFARPDMKVVEQARALSDTPHDDHCRRVAAYCGEIASALAFTDDIRESLQHVALLHHGYEELQNETAMAELFGIAPRIPPLSLNTTEAAVLHGNSNEDPVIRMLVTILDMTDQFDETLEYAPFNEQTRSAMLKGNSLEATDCPATSFVMSYLRSTSRSELASLAKDLPVCPSAALRALRVNSESEVAVKELVAITNTDPVLSGSILQAANSALYATMAPIRGVQPAIIFLGTEAAQRVLVTAALKPLLHTPRIYGLWTHSIEAALLAEAIARTARGIDSDEAYTLGLLHDIGHLLLALAPKTAQERMQRLRDGGVETTVAELVTCGASHAEAGADVLRFWKLPDEYAAAVEFHHEPDRCESVLASLLYVVEFWLGSEEDMASNVRLHYALDRLHVTIEDLQRIKINKPPAYLD
jgi:putative nucleotidyltransferase with HDIG domain